jgi:hypothetical protein
MNEGAAYKKTLGYACKLFDGAWILSITLAIDRLDVQIFNTFITVLYMYMFRAISCSSSGGQIVLTL